MSGRQVMQSKYVGETRAYTFDFISVVGYSENLTSASCVASVYSGVDANPSAIISGASTISATTTSKQALQKITGGVAGCIYLITCTAVTASGETLVVEGLLAILPSP